MVYDRTFNFSVREIEIETKKYLGSWITKGKKKSSYSLDHQQI